MEWSIVQHQELASTNATLLQLVRDGKASAGHVIVAQEQTNGRGRDGRIFASPHGGLYCSLLIGKTHMPSLYPLLCAHSVCEALRSFRIDVSIKWPNDLMVDGKKVGGILCESVGDWIIMGVGINTNSALSQFPHQLQHTIITLHGRGIENCALLERFLSSLEVDLGKEVPRLISDYTIHCSSLGKEVSLRDGTQGHARDIGESGELVLDVRGKEVKVISPVELID